MTPKKHNRFICLLSLLVIQSTPLFSQGLQKEWTRAYSADPSKANAPVAALVAPDGTLVVAGTSESSTGDKDYQIIKYRGNGDEVWRTTFASPTAGTADIVRAMSIDPNGNIIVTGTTATVKFNSAGQQKWNTPIPGWAVIANSEFIYLTGISDIDIVTAQLQNSDIDGQENWRRTIDAFGFVDIGQAITLDGTGNVYVGGMVGSQCGAGTCRNTFGVVCYSSSGVQRFFGYIPPAAFVSYVQVFSILTLEDGSPVIFGTDEGPVFAKFDPTDVFEWKHTHFSLFASYGSRMIRDRVSGNFLIAGRRPVSGRPMEEAFIGVVKQDRTYQRIWSYSGSIGFTLATDIVQDSKGNVIVVGWSENDVTSSSMFAAKLTSAGQQIGLDRYVTPGKVSNFAVAAAVDAADNAYVTGYTVNAQGGTEWVTIKYPAAPKIEQKPNGAMHLEFHTLPGRQYSIEGTTNFLDWQNLITANADANGVVQYDDTNAPTIPYRFYRGSYFP